MDKKGLIGNLIKDFSSAFLEDAAKNNSEFGITDRIYCNFWRHEMLKALDGHDFDVYPLTDQNVANWFVRYCYALCEDPNARNVRDCLKICNSLRIFPPRANFLSTLEHKSPRSKLYNTCEGIRTANPKLDANNFIEHFQLLLEIEDVETLHDYLLVVQTNVVLTKRAPFRFRASIKPALNGRNAQEFVSSKIDEVVVISKSGPFDPTLADNCIKVMMSQKCQFTKLVVASVNEISESEVLFEISPTDKIPSNPVDLIFRPTRYPIRYQYRSLTLLAQNEGMRQFLFPDRNLQRPQIADLNNNFNLMTQNIINKKICENPEQLAAVSRITGGRITSNAPFIIFGPPGTGKTTTIVESILQLRLQHSDSRILVTAGSNSACDTIALRICEYFKSSSSLKQYFENATVLPLLRIYSRSIVDRGIESLPMELRRQSNVAWLNGEHAYPAKEDIHRYGIIVATLCTVGKLVCGNVGAENFFTHVFIDEAGAVSEPETLVGIIGIKNELNDECRIILCGDHKQLGPVIKSDYAAKNGLAKSLMQRLLERECYAVRKNGDYDRSLQIRLRRNFRSHPKIVHLYNKLYYGGDLIAMSAQNGAVNLKWPFLQNPDFPIAFHAVCGQMSKGGTTSSCNLLEIQVVVSYVSLLLRDYSVGQSDIGVITPYRLQSERIKSRLEEQQWSAVEVGSVEYFQGREKSIVIASMVRSKNGLGFVKNKKRLNVLLSRPKVLLIILGEPVTLSSFYDIKYIIETCKIRGNYFDETNNPFGQLQIQPLVKQKKMQKKKSKNKKKLKKNATKSEFKALSETSSNLSKATKDENDNTQTTPITLSKSKSPNTIVKNSIFILNKSSTTQAEQPQTSKQILKEIKAKSIKI